MFHLYINHRTDGSIDQSINHLDVDHGAIQVASVIIVRYAGDHASYLSRQMDKFQRYILLSSL